MKKSIPALLTIFFASMVSAGPVEGVEQLLRGLTEIIGLIFRFLFDTLLEINSVDELLFAKIIFLVLIYLVIYVTINKNGFFGEKDSVITKVITAAISILAVRFIPDDLIRMMFLQYGAMGAAIGMIIPFIIILFFLHQSNFGSMVRRVGWVIYGISYLAIFSYSSGAIDGITDYVYWSGLLAIIVSFIFDRQIHSAFGTAEIRKANRDFEAGRLPRLRQEQRSIASSLGSTGITEMERKMLEKRQIAIEKQISKILKKL